MARRSVGSKGDVMPKGNLIYADNPSASTQFALLSDTARVQGTSPDGAAPAIVSTKEGFIFYPGASALSSTSTITGMVLSGVRQGSATITSANAASTYWSSNITFAPIGRGKIDGLSTGGVITGQITVGLTAAAAATCDAKVTARMRNNAGSTYTTCLFLSATVIAVGATAGVEIYKTYDINHLLTDANFNAVPFDFAIGVQSDKAAASCAVIGRVMESSYIMGEFEPGT